MAELIQLASPRGALTRSVIFVHGLDGDLRGTWTTSPSPGAVWPKWLAEDVEGLAVWSIGYEAPMSNWRGSAMELSDRAANVLSRLLVEPNLREGELIFVGHSLGGLVIKQVLRKTEDAAPESDSACSFVERTRKVAFLATPHVGADLARWGDRLRILVRPSAATQSLLRNDTHLRDLNLWYRRWARQRGIEHKILFETKATSLFGMIVKPDSSDPGLSSDPIPIDADHITIARPPNREHLVYALIRDFVERQVEHTITEAERTRRQTEAMFLSAPLPYSIVEELGKAINAVAHENGWGVNTERHFKDGSFYTLKNLDSNADGLLYMSDTEFKRLWLLDKKKRINHISARSFGSVASSDDAVLGANDDNYLHEVIRETAFEEVEGPAFIGIEYPPDGGRVFSFRRSEDAPRPFLVLSRERLTELRAMIAVLRYASVANQTRSGMQAAVRQEASGLPRMDL